MKLKEIQYHPLTCQISAVHCSSWSEDNSLAALTRNGILVVDFHFNPFDVTTTIQVRQNLIRPNLSLPTNQFHDQFEDLIKSLEREELFLLILDKTFSPTFGKAEKFVPVCKQFSWSPRGLNYLNRCLLAVITDAGSCDIYIRERQSFIPFLSISDAWIKVCLEQWSGASLESFSDLQNKVKKLKIQAILWSHDAGHMTKKAALLVCAHENSEISFWRIETLSITDENPQKQLISTFQPELSSEIKALCWTKISSRRSILGISCLNGTVHGLDLEHDEELQTCQLKSTFCIWSHADRIVVNKILISLTDASDLCIILSKSFHIVAAFFSLNFEEEAMLLEKFSSPITGVDSISSNKFLVVLQNGKISLVTTNPSEKSWKIDEIEKDISYSNYSCQGLCLSTNKTLVILFNSVAKHYDTFLLRQTAHYYVTTIPREVIDPLSVVDKVFQSDSYGISHVSDAMKALKLSFLRKERPVSDIALDKLDLDEMTNCGLQGALQLSQAFAVTDSMYAGKWEKLQEKIKVILYCRYILKKNLQNILVKKWLLKEIKNFDDSLSKLKSKCEEFCQSIPDNGSGSQCEFCNSDITDVFLSHCVCSAGHFTPLCSLSLQPCLIVPYCICDGCNAIALREIVSNFPEPCVLCADTFQFDTSFL